MMNGVYDYGLSFVIPAYNEQKNIAACVTAIREEIQRVPLLHTEIIVVDNASIDDTAKIAADLGVKVVHEDTKGIVHARNAGYRAARYKFIANVDADNRVPAGWIQQGLVMARLPNTAAVTGPLVYDGVPAWVNLGADFFYLLARFFHHTVGPTVQGGNYIIRKDVLDKMGGYDTNYKFYGEDSSTAQSASRFGKIRMAPKMWIYSSSRRITAEGVFKTMWVYTLNYFWVSLFGRGYTKNYLDHR